MAGTVINVDSENNPARKSRDMLSNLHNTEEKKPKVSSHPLDQILPVFNLNKDSSFIPTLKIKSKIDPTKLAKGNTFQKEMKHKSVYDIE